ncbi:MAG: tyrosine-type recombinase/integrase [Terracidiphilus sp.]|nr:tyrosine-type recombinase/integrase [Terracidiphilus sp.]
MAGLTDTEIKRAKVAEKAYSLGDGGGLYLWVKPTGGKLWRWSYRFEGKEKLMSLGKYPDVSLAQARERHSEARKIFAAGVDPMAQRKVAKAAEKAAVENSFQSITTRWLEHWQEGISPRHVDYVKRRMETDILPCLGARPTAEIEAPELVAMAKAIQERGARDIAKRALETVGQVFRYGIAHGYSKRNPAAEIRPSDILKSTRKVNYARVDARELPALLRNIEVYQGTHVTRLAMKVLAMTFVRTSELIQAKWAEFDLEAARWDIPAERMKMRTPHIVPLATQALETLAILHNLTGHSEWLFPGDRNLKKPMSNNTILKALERMGYKGRMTGHGFRGLASTILHEQGYNHDHIELQLAHAARNAVSAAYNHALYLEPRARMMQDWADFLEQTQRGGKILPFRGTAA